MSFKHTVSTVYTAEDGQVGSSATTYTADAVGGYDGTVAKGESPVQIEVDLAIDKDKLVAVCLLSDQAVTIHTNATNGAGGNTISLAAGKPVVWTSDSSAANPFAAADVTKLYITNASSSVDAKVKLRWLVDSTP